MRLPQLLDQLRFHHLELLNFVLNVVDSLLPEQLRLVVGSFGFLLLQISRLLLVLDELALLHVYEVTLVPLVVQFLLHVLRALLVPLAFLRQNVVLVLFVAQGNSLHSQFSPFNRLLFG